MLDHTSDVVATHWSELPEPIRNVLRLSAYIAMDERLSARGIVRHFPSFLKAVYLATKLVVNGGDPAISCFIKSKERYIETILGAIERENPDYALRLSGHLSNLPTAPTHGLTARQYMERIRELSDTAV